MTNIQLESKKLNSVEVQVSHPEQVSEPWLVS